MKPISLVLLLVWLGVLAWLVYANATLVQGASAARQLRASGVVAPARVLDTGQSIHGQASTYKVSVAFTPPGGAPITLRQTVDFATWANAKNSRQAQVRYLPQDPRRAEVVGNQQGGLTTVLVILLDVVFVGFSGFLAWALITRR